MFGNQSVVLTVLWPKKGTLCPIYLIETMSAVSMPRMRTPAMVPTIVRISWNAEREKRRVGTASPKQTPPPTPLLHRYGNSQWFLAKNTMGLWSVTPLPGPGWVGGSLPLTLCPLSPPTVSSEQRDKLARRKKTINTMEAVVAGLPGLHREWDLTWGPLYLPTSAAFACRHSWFCW